MTKTLGWLTAAALTMLLMTGPLAGEKDAKPENKSGGKPYEVSCEGDGPCQVDLETYIGWRTYNGNCARCHGEGGVGSTIGPNLMDRISKRNIDYDKFHDVIANGMSGEMGVMPGWKNDPNVMPKVDKIWAYLLARTDGVLPVGRPEKKSEGNLPDDAPSNWE